MSATAGPKRGRPSTFPRDRVVRVAMDAYWSEGPEAVSLNEICRRAAVSKPGLYRAFGGEDPLVVAALDHYAETVLVRNAAMVDPEAPIRDSLAALIVSFTEPDREGPAGCLLARLQHTAGLAPEVEDRVASLRRQARGAYASLIDAAKERGEIAESISTDVAAAMIDIQCNAVLLRMAAGDDPDLLRAQALLAFSVFD